VQTHNLRRICRVLSVLIAIGFVGHARGGTTLAWTRALTAPVPSAAAADDSTPYAGYPITLPGTIEAENFDWGGAEVAYHDDSAGNTGGTCRDSDVDIADSADAGGGYVVGWAGRGEWLKYSVIIAAAGPYAIDVRVALLDTGGAFHLEIDDRPVTGRIGVPNTGGWQAWTTVTADAMLPAGTHVLRLVMDEAGGTGATGNFNWIRVRPPSTPYTGAPVPLPGTIEAENFDRGGAEVAYHDDSAGNIGGVYRSTDVDLADCADADGRFVVGWAGPGEWLKYTVSLAAAGAYTIVVRVALFDSGGAFHLEIDGSAVTGRIPVPYTGGWQTWTTVTADAMLPAGRHVLRLVMDEAGSTGATGNFDWIRVRPAAPAASTPYSGAPIALPGTIEAENFDLGGAEVAYHDDAAGNTGGVYRATDGDIAESRNPAGGFVVGWADPGEWLKYTVSIAAAGAYLIDVRVASLDMGGTFHLELDEVPMTGRIAVPDTRGWQAWTIVTVDAMLPAGTHVLRLVMDEAGHSGAIGNFDWVHVRREQSDALAFTMPAPGSTLRTRTVTFQWTGTGDDFSLTIGTAPGGADVYASGSLGPVPRHTVSNLPLDGRRLYVELRRTLGSTSGHVVAEYVAPVRKGLAVITDFTDRQLEGWTGPGMKSEDDLSLQLRKLEDHWSWLSHGLERFQWNIVRIQLDKPAVADGFASWWEFRNTLAALVRQHVDVADYDIDSDGVLDVSWAIVCSGDANVPFAIGGASRNGGVNMFIDGQASDSVKGGHTANFTHEAAHLLGIPDMYGAYGTLGSLTIMSYSWDLPPGDFAAYERQTLGWLKPQVVSETTQALWLPAATDQIAAVKVPTQRAYEYFLIEYRHKPAGGYGSADVPYDGLVVYHVFEGSSMGQYPPIVKVEPADGNIPTSHPTDPFDFLYPGNPSWTPPLALYSYFDNSAPVFEIDNVRWVDGGMMFDITVVGGGR
jgi:M6 family metalloprotease-like protein